MTEQEALSKSSGYFKGRKIGYLPLSAANALVKTGKYRFFRADCWGYIVEMVS
jgi:hypothetical protein